MSVATLVAGVGYPLLRDYAVGPVLAAELQNERWPDSVQVDDYSFGPVAVVHRWQSMAHPFDKAIVFGAVKRGRRPGEIARYRFVPPPMDRDDVQARVAEAVTGVISLDNLLIIAHAFGVLPKVTVVVEIEPTDQSWGEGFTPEVAAALPELKRLLRKEAESEAAAS